MAAAAELKPLADQGAPQARASGARCAGTDPAQLSLADIDWQAPWLTDWRAVGEPLAQGIAADVPLHEVLNADAVGVRAATISSLSTTGKAVFCGKNVKQRHVHITLCSPLFAAFVWRELPSQNSIPRHGFSLPSGCGKRGTWRGIMYCEVDV